MIRTSLAPPLAVLACMAMVGCESAPNHPALEVVRDGALSDQSLEVDVIGVTAETAPTYLSADVSRYFSTRSRLRSAAQKYTMKFGADEGNAQTLGPSDPAWKQWGSPASLVLLADIPGMTGRGQEDPRRVVLPVRGAEPPLRVRL